jgi:D-3-phosphoglycerate dehydrogenase
MLTVEDVMRRSDAVVICAPLNEATRGLVDAAAIGLLPRGSWLVNVSRGGIVTLEAVCDALETGHLAGVALDVFEEEPLPEGARLRDFPQAILGSHNASNTHEGVARTNHRAVSLLLETLGL